jgi:hypothetical protein
MDLTGLITRIQTAAFYIDSGRRGLDTDGQEHEGRLSYEIGISGSLQIFQEIQSIRDSQAFVLSEVAFLQQEMSFCDETDNTTKSSLTKAIQSFEDALRCIKTTECSSYTRYQHERKSSSRSASCQHENGSNKLYRNTTKSPRDRIIWRIKHEG